jgi:chromosome partitioning protein
VVSKNPPSGAGSVLFGRHARAGNATQTRDTGWLTLSENDLLGKELALYGVRTRAAPNMEMNHIPPAQAIFLTTASEKGGQGKTCTTANLGTLLTLMGFRVLLLDLDPAGGLTFTFGIDQERLKTNTLYEALLAIVKETDDCPIQNVILETWYDAETRAFVDAYQRVNPKDATSPLVLDEQRGRGVKLSKGPYIAPISRAAIRADAELQAAAPLTWMHALNDALQPVIAQFDYILADTNPQAGILTALSLCSCPYFYVPITPEQLSVNGALHLFKTVKQTRRTSNPHLQLAGILFTRVANYKGYEVMMGKLRAGLAQELSHDYPDWDFPFFKTIIQQSRDGIDASNDRSVAVIHRPYSPHAISYWYLLAELLATIRGPANAIMPDVLRGIKEYEDNRQAAAEQRKVSRGATRSQPAQE